ncbi:MAG TPA: hypothetical protein GX506_03445, partial [Firmicutes bacterium]|nr:hypothetical protein [Bacillota bacterium]
MAGAINAWVRDIIIMVIVLTFIEMMLPQNGLKRMVRVVVGVAIIGVILNPVLDIQTTVKDLPTLERMAAGVPGTAAAGPGAGAHSLNTFIERGRRVAAAGEAAAAAAAGSRLERQVRALVLMAPGIEDASVKVTVSGSGEITGIDIGIVPRPTGETGVV